jgi:drug/metabolite transporter (DMT)-like permease
MARDGLFFRRAGTLNRNNVPSAALIAQSIWTSLLCLTGTYGQLLNYVIFAALIIDESPSRLQLAGAGCILVGLIVATIGRRQIEAPEPELAG